MKTITPELIKLNVPVQSFIIIEQTLKNLPSVEKTSTETK